MGLCILDHFKPSAQLAALMRGKTLHKAVHIHVHVLNGSIETEGSLHCGQYYSRISKIVVILLLQTPGWVENTG